MMNRAQQFAVAAPPTIEVIDFVTRVLVLPNSLESRYLDLSVVTPSSVPHYNNPRCNRYVAALLGHKLS